MMGISKLPLDQIRIDGGTQQRQLDESAVADYIQLLKDGSEAPPINVVFDGKDYWPWDGFHRYHAASKAGIKTIAAIVTKGTQRDAVWLSFSANKDHGVRRQKGVIKDIILKILADPDWKKVSQHDIARHVGTSHGYVRDCIASMRIRIDAPPAAKKNRPTQKQVHRGGKSYTMETANIGQPAEPDPDNFYDHKADKPEQVKDEVGNVLNPEIAKVFERRQELKEYMRRISEMKCAVLKAIDLKDALFREISAAQIKANCENLYRQFSFAIPYALCPLHADDPLGRKTCTGCKETGWVTQAAYDRIMASKKRSA